MKPLTILLLITLLFLAAYRFYDWWICTRIDRKNRREKKKCGIEN